MKPRKRTISSNILTGIVVGGFVALVIFGLIYTSTLQGTTGNQLSFQQLTLFGGNASQHSYTSNCLGAALLELYAQNPTSAAVRIQDVVIYGSGVVNATVYISLSNACLTLQESGVSVPASGDYQLEGYVNAPLSFASAYRCIITFSNGQRLNQSLIAQS